MFLNLYKQIKEKIESSIGVENIHHLEANDLSDGCGAKFELIIASDTFEGVGLLDRQRRINEILKEEMKTIHALSLK